MEHIVRSCVFLEEKFSFAKDHVCMWFFFVPFLFLVVLIAVVTCTFCKYFNHNFPEHPWRGKNKRAFLQFFSGVLITKVIDFWVVNSAVLDSPKEGYKDFPFFIYSCVVTCSPLFPFWLLTGGNNLKSQIYLGRNPSWHLAVPIHSLFLQPTCEIVHPN